MSLLTDAQEKKRNFVFVAHDFETFEVPDQDRRFVYCSYQGEKCPKTGGIHLQGYIEFNVPLTYRQVMKLMKCDMWVKERRESRVAAREYTRKLKSRWCEPIEFGVWRQQGTRTDLKNLTDLIDAGKTDAELRVLVPTMVFKFKKKIADYRTTLPQRERAPPQVKLIYGDTGRGKSSIVWEKEGFGELYPVPSTNLQWFDGYHGQEAVLIDDYDGGAPIAFLLRLLDRYPMQVPYKGGFVQWIPRRIYITSNMLIEQWYPEAHPQQIAGLKRRITSIVDVRGDGPLIKEEPVEKVVIDLTDDFFLPVLALSFGGRSGAQTRKGVPDPEDMSQLRGQNQEDDDELIHTM